MRAEFKGTEDTYELILRGHVIPVKVDRDAVFGVNRVSFYGARNNFNDTAIQFAGTYDEFDNFVDALVSLREQVQNG